MTYSSFLTSSSNDILLLAEFRQIAGPTIIKCFPESPQLLNRTMQQSDDDLNALTLKAMSMKFNFDDEGEQLLPFNDDSYILTEFEDLPNYTCLWYFTYLPDLSARGFARRVGIAFISANDEKFERHADCISFGFEQALLCIKYALCASYRYEAVQYAGILETNAEIIADAAARAAAGEKNEDVARVIQNYTPEALEDLRQKLLSLRFDLLNQHAGLVMDFVPLFYQLYMTDEVNGRITEPEFGQISLDDADNAYKRVKPVTHIVPQNYCMFIAVPPHELRIQKRQELRDFSDIATPAFYNYFIQILSLIYSYFNQSVADLEFAEIATQHCIQAKINGGAIKGVWYGKNLFIPCQVDELFALSYTLQSYKKYRELYIVVHYNKMHSWLAAQGNYRVEEAAASEPAPVHNNAKTDEDGEAVEGELASQNGPEHSDEEQRDGRADAQSGGIAHQIVEIRCPYAPIREQFAASFYSMFPYLPQLQQKAASLTSSFPAYGHFLRGARDIIPQQYFRTAVSVLLAGQNLVILTDSKAFAELVGQAMEPFLVSSVLQGERFIIAEDEQFSEKDAVEALLSIHIVNQVVEIKNPDYYCLEMIFGQKEALFYGGNEFLQCLEEIYMKEEPSVFCISRKLECIFRELTMDCLFEEKKKGYFEGLVFKNINCIAQMKRNDKVPVEKKKWGKCELQYASFEDFGEKIGIFVMGSE